MTEHQLAEYDMQFHSIQDFPDNSIDVLNAWTAEHGLPSREISIPEQSTEKDSVGIKTMRASNSGGAIECPRSLVFDALGIEPDRKLEATSLRTFRTGWMEHEALRSDMVLAGLPIHDIETEGEITDFGLDSISGSVVWAGKEVPREGVSFHCDYEIETDLRRIGAGSTEEVLTDIKTTTKYKIDSAKRGDPDLRAVAQVNLMCFGRYRRFGSVLWQAKEKQWLYGVIFERNEQLARDTANGFLSVWSAVQNRDEWEGGYTAPIHRSIEPSPRSKNLPWQCGYCSHVYTCWGKGNVTFQGGKSGKDPYKLRVNDAMADL